MCKNFIPMLTWRISSFFIAVFLFVISFMFGPVYLVLYSIDQETAENTQKLDVEQAFFSYFIMTVMLLIFASAISLMYSVVRKDVMAAKVFIEVTAVHMVISFIMSLRWVIVCCFFDEHCFNHKDRMQNDRYTSLIMFVGNLVLIIFWLGVLFVVVNYKITLAKRNVDVK